MKLIDCAGAYRALAELAKMEWSYADAHAIVTLKQALEPEVRFYCREELALVERITGGAPDREGNFNLEGQEQALQFRRKRQELEQVQVLEGLELPIRLTAPARIRPELLEQLGGFVSFEEGSA